MTDPTQERGDHPAIQLRDVTKTYSVEAQTIEALRGASLEIVRGQAVAVVGKSGAGKSTLLHVIGMLDTPTSGQVVLEGNDVSKLPDDTASRMRNNTVGFVFQASHLLPEFSAIENVMMPGLISGASKEPVRQRAEKLLGAVGLAERLNHRPGELSGGEQQRVSIARALTMAPRILLADEPTGNLDNRTSHSVQDLLLELCHTHQITMLLVTHDGELADRLPGRVVMEDGRIVEGGA